MKTDRIKLHFLLCETVNINVITVGKFDFLRSKGV